MYPQSTFETLAADPYFAAVVLAICSIILLLAFKDRRYVLFGYLFFLPFLSMPIVAGRLAGIPGLSVQNLVMGMGLYAIFLTRSQKIRMEPRLRMALVLYWIAVAGAVLHGMFYLDELIQLRIYGYYGIYDYLRNFLFMPALSWLSFVAAYRYASAGADRATEYLRYAGIAILGYAALILGTVAYYFSQFSNFYVVRVMVTAFIGSHSNDYSFVFAMGAPILIAGIVSKKIVRQRDRILFWLALAGAAVAVLFSYSRSGYLALALSVFGFALLIKRSLLWLLIPAFVGLAIFGPASVIERVQFGFESAHPQASLDWNDVSAGRLTMAKAALDKFTSDIGQTALGGGRLTFPRATYTKFGVDSPHNAYLEVLLDAGVIGFVPIVGLFLLMFFRTITGMRRMRTSEFRAFYAAAAISLGSFLILGVTGRSFFPELQLVFVWQVSGFALGLLRYDMTRTQQQIKPARIS